MRFEFDATKSSTTNRLKHGIDFIDAPAPWNDPDRLGIAARRIDEPAGRSSAVSETRCGRRSSPIAKAKSASSRFDGHEPRNEHAMSDVDALSADRLGALHDAGADMTPHLDIESGRRPGRETRPVSVDFPVHLLDEIDREAGRLGVTRQAFITARLADAVLPRQANRGS
jgi:hypothetical protein